jgi:hypothetical protein
MVHGTSNSKYQSATPILIEKGFGPWKPVFRACLTTEEIEIVEDSAK